MYESLGRYLIGFANVLMVLTSLFLICLVLIQRGKGGGLAGAFGGAGGSSAFGTKAGDVFTRVTIITAGFWFLLAMLLVYSNNRGGRSKFGDPETAASPVSDIDLDSRKPSLSDKNKNKNKATEIPDPLDLNKDLPVIPPVAPSGKSTAPATTPPPPTIPPGEPAKPKP